ncbi:MAG: TlpA family protein disulfide reductase [Ruminococcaceae bacterium]|nr:TlpA family protein disulfide reductase [Oscillospiraceae bacterium]
MSERTKTILIIFFSILILIGIYLLYDILSERYMPENDLTETDTKEEKEEGSNGQNNESQNNYEQAKDFTVLDVEGNKVSLNQKIGKPIVLNFWASWCPPCKAEMPDFEKAYKQYGSDVEFMMINSTDGKRETVETAKQFIESKGYSFPIYFDTEFEASFAYETYSLPTTYFIDRNGNIVTYAIGKISASALEKGISLILK